MTRFLPLALLCVLSIMQSNAQQYASPNVAVPFLGAYNSETFDHFYSTEPEEMNYAVEKEGFTRQDYTGRIFRTQEYGTVALYRAYNPHDTIHLFTTSLEEAQHAVGYIGQSTAGYIYPNDGTCSGVIPLYRLYNAERKDRIYTSDVNERAQANLSGYLDEGITGFVVKK